VSASHLLFSHRFLVLNLNLSHNPW